MKGTPYEQRGSGAYADLAAWAAAQAEDNGGDIRRLKRNLRAAREEVLTARQREMLRLSCEEGMSMTQIARALGVAPSTVSRTLARAKRRLYKSLRYTL